jgi:hypothetical protein
MKATAVLALVICIGALKLEASVVYTFSDGPSGVQLAYSGSLNTAALDFQGGLTANGISINTSGAGDVPYEFENFQPSSSGSSYRYVVNDISYSWNLATTPSGISASSGYGETFGFYFYTGNDTTWLNLPFDYTSGAPITGGMLFAGQTLASMGLNTTESFEVFLPGNQIISASVTPEPAPAFLMLSGLMGVVGFRRFCWNQSFFSTRPGMGIIPRISDHIGMRNPD